MDTASRPGHGVAAWRLISEELRREIADGVYPAGSKLPSEAQLAQRFGVHRNTVRHAVSVLTDEGYLAPRRGSGTYVTERQVMVHRIGPRTRLSTSLAPDGRTAPGELLGTGVATPPADDATRLGLGDRPARWMTTRRLVADEVIAYTTHWWVEDLTRGLAEAFAESGSITASLQSIGIDDYLRASTVVGARSATADEAQLMDVAPGAVLLVVRSTDTLVDGAPLQTAVTRFRADRIELDVEMRDTGPRG